MLISNFNLCKSEWLELVFDKRNKEYGAYYLRRHYADNMVRAMSITFFSVISTMVLLGILIKAHPEIPVQIKQVILNTYVPPVQPKKEVAKPKPVASKPVPPVTQQKYVEMVVTPDPIALEPPKMADLIGTIGPIDIKVPGSGIAKNVDPEAGKGGTGNAVNTVNNDILTPEGLDVMPEPYDGAAGWTKFLQKNIKYPPDASEKNVSGKVLISFVIEKDGHLSNITVNRGAGFGMDEEALRVLKLSKAWKPGLQNGQPVRVRYIVPINFTITQ